ncbi:GTP-binding protein [Microaceticoccus formicicus]|uniref:GTP-binding protein n=1 Tax=Microaceticoccus formicicus TaxID=3118105 RepID=UPI003CD03903|nr:GTP-binding protein [Peptoniphilaceae bacterium AMB_02]
MSVVYIISGFLGSGKTTLINNLLKDNDEKILIVENEVGNKPFDGEILKRENVDVANLLSGCICCTMATDFKKAILENKMFDKIIIEPSGVAQLSQVLRQLEGENNIYPCTVIEADEFLDSVDFFGDFFKDQIINAGTIILNTRKSSLSGQYKKEIERLKSLNPLASILKKDLINDKITFDNLRKIHDTKTHISKLIPDKLEMDTKIIEKPIFKTKEELIEEVNKTVSSEQIYRVKGNAILNNKIFKVDYAANSWTFEETNTDCMGIVIIHKD